MTLREEVSYPTDTTEDVIAKIKVVGIKYGNADSTIYNNTGWRVGGGPNGGVLALKLTMKSPQIIRSQTIAGTLLQSGNLSFKISWSYGYGPVSGELDLSYDENKNLNSAVKQFSTPVKISSAYKTAANQSLALTGNEFSSGWDIAYDSSLGTQSATATTLFKYSVYNENSKKNLGVIEESSTSTNAILSK
ncbi:hypothetical protein [Paenibacillus pinistramenti]|uniref:hypothetical protein n=1 Tax=Paenibacillus pinistramenti TaxID=1768003 RepID=UPI0011084C08|nr:hypothetical protein [Paenibacillus pinistramenti]